MCKTYLKYVSNDDVIRNCNHILCWFVWRQNQGEWWVGIVTPDVHLKSFSKEFCYLKPHKIGKISRWFICETRRPTAVCHKKLHSPVIKNWRYHLDYRHIFRKWWVGMSNWMPQHGYHVNFSHATANKIMIARLNGTVAMVTRTTYLTNLSTQRSTGSTPNFSCPILQSRYWPLRGADCTVVSPGYIVDGRHSHGIPILFYMTRLNFVLVCREMLNQTLLSLEIQVFVRIEKGR